MKFAIFQISYEKHFPVSRHFPAKTDQQKIDKPK